MEIGETNYLLTIAIPTYNRKNLLKRALDSIIPQLNPKIEVLVSDNASDDGTDKMMDELFPMVRYIKNNTNIGADGNFLQCYKEARGKYVILLGSDDRLATGALNYLTEFLVKYDCDLTFVNFRFYDVTKKEVYIKNGEWIKNYDQKNDIVTINKNLFMKYANHSITYISASIIKRSLVVAVRESERFSGTYFLHTCLMLEALKNMQPKFGVVMKPFIEANATTGDAEMSKTPGKTFTVFGKYMYAILCDHAVECGFSSKCMKKVYLQYLHDYPFWKAILSFRAKNNKEAIDNYWKDGNPVVKKYPMEWVKSMIAAFMPQFIVIGLYKVYQTLKQRR